MVLSSARLHTLTVLRDRHRLARALQVTNLESRSSALLNAAAAEVLRGEVGLYGSANVTKWRYEGTTEPSCACATVCASHSRGLLANIQH